MYPAVFTLKPKAVLSSTAFLFLCLLFAGCASPDSFGGSRRAVVAWSQAQGFTPVDTGQPILGLLRHAEATAAGPINELTIYIEGDGAPWPSPWQPPHDPTPQQPVALALAAQDPAALVIYLGRPCQYLDAEQLATCPPAYWTTQRFSADVLERYQILLDRLKQDYGTEHLRLVGHSGGGVLATLLAGTRPDVRQLITVAAPLAVSRWTDWHQLTPLHGSLDPASLLDTATFSLPPATHFIGAQDHIVPGSIVSAFIAATGGKLRTVAGFDHVCCWSRDWASLLKDAP